MTNSEWLKTIAGPVIGFLTASFILVVSEYWKEWFQKRRLQKSLYREVVAIQKGLEDLLAFLKAVQSGEKKASQAKFSEFVKARCYESARSSAVFWRLDDALDLDEIHREFLYLSERTPSDQRDDIIAIEQVLNGVKKRIQRSRIDKGLFKKLAR